MLGCSPEIVVGVTVVCVIVREGCPPQSIVISPPLESSLVLVANVKVFAAMNSCPLIMWMEYGGITIVSKNLDAEQ